MRNTLPPTLPSKQQSTGGAWPGHHAGHQHKLTDSGRGCASSGLPLTPCCLHHDPPRPSSPLHPGLSPAAKLDARTGATTAAGAWLLPGPLHRTKLMHVHLGRALPAHSAPVLTRRGTQTCRRQRPHGHRARRCRLPSLTDGTAPGTEGAEGLRPAQTRAWASARCCPPTLRPPSGPPLHPPSHPALVFPCRPLNFVENTFSDTQKIILHNTK